ncbi:MAG: Tad domain-containing protein [Roseobacter sp.]
MIHLVPPIPRNSFLQSEDGAATPFAIFIFCIFVVIGGLAVDFNKATSERTQMQLATDTAAHAALYSWEFKPVNEATTTAVAAVEGMLPDVAYFDALRGTDIEYGFWDSATLTFTADPTFVEEKDNPLRSAVRATAQLEEARSNQSKTILLSIIGRDRLSIRTDSVYASYYPPCFNEGFVAQDVVDLQSNNSYTDGFCIHSNTYVSLNQNNYFEPGTVVSMPSMADLDIPSSGFEKNEGLQEALRKGAYRMRLLTQMPMMMQTLRDGYAKYAVQGGVMYDEEVLWPVDVSAGGGGSVSTSGDDTTTTGNGKGNNKKNTDSSSTPDNTPVTRFKASDSGKKNLVAASFDQPNRIYQLECSSNGDITFAAETFSDFVLITDCPIKFSNGTILEDVLIATEGDVNASHVQIGKDDNCAPGGGASIWTYGDVKTASALSGYGAQILALGDIQFTANANGVKGVSFIAGGRIDGTSNSNMGFCNNGGTENFATARYFRMVE